MILSLLVARAENGVIGRDGALPWHLPDDLRRFKALTLGRHVVMGRRTHESIGRPLPGRVNVVLSRTAGLEIPGCVVAASLDAALAAAPRDEEVFVIGGAAVYEAALPRADRAYVTLVHAEVDGDVTFPPLDETAWTCCASEHHAADERHEHAMSFRRYDRRAAGGA